MTNTLESPTALEDCPKCGQEGIPPELGWDTLGQKIKCTHCDTELEVEYEESYDPESGEESGYFWLEKVTA